MLKKSSRLQIPRYAKLTVLGIALGLFSYQAYLQVFVASIMVVDQPYFAYGPTLLSGTIQESPDTSGSVLVLPSGDKVWLDVIALDTLAGQEVSVTGDLFPAVPITGMPKMVVSEVYE